MAEGIFVGALSLACSRESILDLTKYDVGNALRKEHALHKSMEEGEFHEFLSLFGSIIQRTQVLPVGAQDLFDVADITVKEGISIVVLVLSLRGMLTGFLLSEGLL
jgi:hypothetical protein